jgi:hypothetical protein
MAKGIIHKISTVEKIAVKNALVNDDLKVLIDGEDDSVDITSLLNRFKGKTIDITISEKTEEEIEEDLSEYADLVDDTEE